MEDMQKAIADKVDEVAPFDREHTQLLANMGSALSTPLRARFAPEGRAGRLKIFGVKHVYGGTVPSHVKAKRRAKNKVASKSRKANR
jgi:hypothetical protein